MEVRPAKQSEIFQLIPLIKQHYDSTGFPQELGFDGLLTFQFLYAMAENDQSLLLVLSDNDYLVGVLGMQMADTFFTDERAARELFLYIAPEYRGRSHAFEMINKAEAWAKSKLATAMIIGNHPLSPPYVGALYERHGYRQAQTDYIRKL